jgi:hypothetical protein
VGRNFLGIRRRVAGHGTGSGAACAAKPATGPPSAGERPGDTRHADPLDGGLADIIRYGAGMLDDVEDAVRRCRSEAEPGADLARTCGTLVSGYLTLRERLGALPATPLSLRVDQLLNYALLVTDQASLLAFRARDEQWQRLADEFGDGLGAPAEELRALAALTENRPPERAG